MTAEQCMDVLKIPGERLQLEDGRALRNDEKFTPLVQRWCVESFCFREYIGLDVSPKQNLKYSRDCCQSNQKDCIPWLTIEGPSSRPQLDVECLLNYGKHLAEAIRRVNMEQFRDYHPAEERTNLFFCGGCRCTLFQFNPEQIKSQQELQCISLVWGNESNCHLPQNLTRILCRACRLLWDLCDSHQETFRRGCDTYFRGFGRAMHHDLCSYAENIMD